MQFGTLAHYDNACDNPTQFGIYIKTDDPDLLTPRMVYEVVPDENAAKFDYIRVIDNGGEDYLYPASYFVVVGSPASIPHSLPNQTS